MNAATAWLVLAATLAGQNPPADSGTGHALA